MCYPRLSKKPNLVTLIKHLSSSFKSYQLFMAPSVSVIKFNCIDWSLETHRVAPESFTMALMRRRRVGLRLGLRVEHLVSVFGCKSDQEILAAKWPLLQLRKGNLLGILRAKTF